MTTEEKIGFWPGGTWEGLRKRWERILEWWLPLSIWPFGRVSRIHYYEAKERYHSLRSLVRFTARVRGLKLPEDAKSLAAEIDKLVADKSMPADDRNKTVALLTCYGILLDTKKFISRRVDDLNHLWRSLTAVRIMLTEHVMEKNRLRSQLNFCHEEAFRLGVSEDPAIKDMLQRLAEVMDDKEMEQHLLFRSILRGLLERFNTIRTGRIHQQYMNVKIYTRALVMLLVFSVPLLLYGDFFLIGAPGDDKVPEYITSSYIDKPADSVFESVVTAVASIILYNRLTFVYFGGLMGGIFSVAMRERPRNRIPGEDAYQTRYIVTKPFIGAAGSVFLYILILGGLVNSHLVDEVGNLGKMGALTFGFAFIAGFSERLVFPSFR